MPLASVIIATYKRPDRLRKAIASVLDQTFSDLEVIVVAETDDTQTLEFMAAQSDHRLRLAINPERGGPGRARDFGVRSSNSKWIAFLDDDDDWLPTKLQEQLDAAGDSDLTIVTTMSYVHTHAGTFIWPTRPYAGPEPIDEWLFDRRSWLRGGDAMLQTSSLLVPRKLFEKIEFGRSHHEEWELVIRATKQLDYTLKTVPHALVNYMAGNTYPWEKSMTWIEEMRGLITPKAYAGFCLCMATKTISGPGRNRVLITMLKQAFARGKPTPRQLFAFCLIWLLPENVRRTIKHRLSGYSSHKGS
jgi:glycosyltransferase involved in cell wall biosynthesis